MAFKLGSALRRVAARVRLLHGLTLPKTRAALKKSGNRKKSLFRRTDAFTATPGQWAIRQYSGSCGSRDYALYIPTGYSRKRIPLIVMLHGCGQTAEDFAAGTRMNELANQQNFMVAYPIQSRRANISRCWNWFESKHQSRGRGEPGIIAGITSEIVSDYRVDKHRVYAAGLSAGAAMAVIMGATYPDRYAAIGVHSGLPYRAASDALTAFSAMSGKKPSTHGGTLVSVAAVPTIVFHGDADARVHFSNAKAIVESAAHYLAQQNRSGEALECVERQRTDRNGRPYTVIEYRANSSPILIESWTVHDAGHSWAGGSPRGSHTDPSGPDASAEMVRFFLQHRLSGQ